MIIYLKSEVILENVFNLKSIFEKKKSRCLIKFKM